MEDLNFYAILFIAISGWTSYTYLYFEIKDLRNIIKYMKEKDK
jgi:hypothetical protein